MLLEEDVTYDILSRESLAAVELAQVARGFGQQDATTRRGHAITGQQVLYA